MSLVMYVFDNPNVYFFRTCYLIIPYILMLGYFFCRRVNSIQWDVRHIESNAEKFNEPRSQIVKFAHIITDLCLKFIA